MNITLSGILSGIIFGTIGIWLFRQSKRRSNDTLKLIGVALIVYPYLVSGIWLEWGLGIALCFWARYEWWR